MDPSGLTERKMLVRDEAPFVAKMSSKLFPECWYTSTKRLFFVLAEPTGIQIGQIKQD